jgi:hypothetical protein
MIFQYKKFSFQKIKGNIGETSLLLENSFFVYNNYLKLLSKMV